MLFPQQPDETTKIFEVPSWNKDKLVELIPKVLQRLNERYDRGYTFTIAIAQDHYIIKTNKGDIYVYDQRLIVKSRDKFFIADIEGMVEAILSIK